MFWKKNTIGLRLQVFLKHALKESWMDYNQRIILVTSGDGKILHQYYVVKQQNIY